MKKIEDLVEYNDQTTNKIKIKNINIINKKLKDAEKALNTTLRFLF